MQRFMSLLDINDSQSSPANDFFKKIRKGPGLIISGCAYSSSGCHNFGDSLNPWKNMQRIKYYRPNKKSRFISCPEASKDRANEFKKTEIQNIVITGCALYEIVSQTYILDDLTTKYNFAKLTHAFFICTPNKSPALLNSIENKITSEEMFNSSLLPLRFNIPVTVLSSGINVSLEHCIGYPIPIFSSFESSEDKDKKNENYCGLIYIRDTNNELSNNLDYLEQFFLQVSKVAKSENEKSVMVICPFAEANLKTKIKMIASNYNVLIVFSEPKPPHEFIKIMKGVAANGGWFGTDGTFALAQALCFGSKVLVLNLYKINNEPHYKELVELFSKNKEERDIAQVMLGITKKFELLQNQKLLAVVHKLQLCILKSAHAYNEKQGLVPIFNLKEMKAELHETVKPIHSGLSHFSLLSNPMVTRPIAEGAGDVVQSLILMNSDAMRRRPK